ncbi:MAG TPA: alpha-amylase family glycosyl hydrolase [Ktedonobacterales bacterium]
MATAFDYFFGPYVTPQEQRLRAVSLNGVAHASEIAPGDPAPGQPVTLSIITDADLPIDRVAVYFTTDGSDPGGALGTPTSGQVALASTAAGASGQVGPTRVRRWQATLPGQPDGALVRYRIDAWSAADTSRRWLADAIDPLGAPAPAPAGREFAYHVDRRAAPDWVHDAIVYHVFVDRFAVAHDQPPMREDAGLAEFHGGTLRGVAEKLDYIASLGVNCLWLSPVMASPTYHGYNPSDYENVAQRYGSNDDLRALIAAAHARGIRVLLDFVANHTSNEHPAFLAARQGTTPEARDWYTFGSEYRNGYLTFFDVEGMPVLKTDSSAVRGYLIDAARHWLTDFNADGLRLDNVSGPAHAFWTHFQEGVKQTHPDALTLGEITGAMTDISTYDGRLDSSMDFPLTREIRRVFALREAPLDELLRSLAAHDARLPALMAPARLLDNHDMHRFLWLAENDTRRLKLALAFLLSMTGFPVLYYGTEAGLSQRAGPPGQDSFAREPMLWGARQQVDVLDRTRWLIAQRAERVSLRRGLMASVSMERAGDAPEQLGALARWRDREATILVINNAESPALFTIETARLPFAVRPDARISGHALAPDGLGPLTGLTSSRLEGALGPLSAAIIYVDSAGQ